MSTKTTNLEHNGANFQLSTYGQSGRGAVCTLRKVDVSADGKMVSFAIFGGWSVTAAKEAAARVTQTVIDRVHAAGLAEYERMKAAGELPEEKVKGKIAIGQVIFSDYIQYQVDDRRAIYKIEETSFGPNYHTVHLDGSTTEIDTHVKPYSEKFGIGTYFNEGDVISEEEVNQLVATATENMRIKREEEQREEIAAAEARAQAIETGRAIVGAINSEYVILGTHKGTTWNMDDTHDTTVIETVVLAFSGHKVRNRAELAAAAANCEKTAHLTAEDYDDSYSMLGSKYNGWSVYKQQLDERGKENVYVAAAEGRYFVKELPACTEQSNVPAGSARIVYNENQDGIEIHHSSKPAQSVIDAIKAAGFRWAKFNKCWYKKDSSYAREVAARYGELPSNLPSSGSGYGHDEMILDQITDRIGA